MLCTCKSPRLLELEPGAQMPTVTVPLGNFAMQATLGFEGISVKRGFVFDMEGATEKALGITPKNMPANFQRPSKWLPPAVKRSE